MPQTRRRFLQTIGSSVLLTSCSARFHATQNAADVNLSNDLRFLHEAAKKVLFKAVVPANEQIPGGVKNTTGYNLRLPGGTLNYYPAFWIRDAAMMLEADFIAADEIEGWIRLTAATQPGESGLNFNRLTVPPYSIPDHITLNGEACWFPGAYAEQGTGAYGFLPPADDAFYFVQMVYEHSRLIGRLDFFRSIVKTAWGEHQLSEVCVKAFESVSADAKTGLVICDSVEGRTRVDWGFCDAILKTGMCLMPSLLRWRAALQLAKLLDQNKQLGEANRLRLEAKKIQSAIVPVFFRNLPKRNGQEYGLLISATGLGHKDDVWASAFAIWLGVLPRQIERFVSRHLVELYQSGEIVAEGQIRHVPLTGELGGHWEKAVCITDHYQNGGYWGTPTGWMVTALRRLDRSAGNRLFAEYISHLRANADQGAPWEWINPTLKLRTNPLYGSSVGLVYSALVNERRSFR